MYIFFNNVFYSYVCKNVSICTANHPKFLFNIQINMNGFISFSINYLSYRPMPFPHDNSENADLLGVFWSDYDSTSINCDCTFNCRTCGRSVVYYHTYSLQEGKTDNVTLQVLSQATTDGLNYIPGFTTATWVMVATWSQMVPFPYSSNQYSYEVSKNIILSMLFYVCTFYLLK